MKNCDHSATAPHITVIVIARLDSGPVNSVTQPLHTDFFTAYFIACGRACSYPQAPTPK